MKICSICNKEKSLDEFYSVEKVSVKKGKYIYYFPYCKECNIKKSSKWISENLDKYRYHNRKTNQNPHRKAQININCKKYREQGKLLSWQRKNKDKINKYTIHRNTYKKHNITEQEWESCKSYFNYECAYCGMTEDEAKRIYKNKLHKDHAIHNGANDLSNCVPACKRCNSKKHNFELEEWYRNYKSFNNKRLEKIQKWLSQDYKIYIKNKLNEL